MENEKAVNEIIISIGQHLQDSFDLVKYEVLADDSILVLDVIISKYGIHKIMLISLYDLVMTMSLVKQGMWSERSSRTNDCSPCIVDLYDKNFMESIKKSYIKLSRQVKKCQK